MGIDLYLEDERGTKIDSVDDSDNVFSSLVERTRLEDTICLRFIDPYGDTTFNQLQVPVLAEELGQLLKTTNEPEARAVLARILEFIGRRTPSGHTYLRFYGD